MDDAGQIAAEREKTARLMERCEPARCTAVRAGPGWVEAAVCAICIVRCDRSCEGWARAVCAQLQGASQCLEAVSRVVIARAECHRLGGRGGVC
jgi:hypothetical protein